MVLELLEGLQGKAGQDRPPGAVVEDFSTCVQAATKLADKDSIAALALAGKVCSCYQTFGICCPLYSRDTANGMGAALSRVPKSVSCRAACSAPTQTRSGPDDLTLCCKSWQLVLFNVQTCPAALTSGLL